MICPVCKSDMIVVEHDKIEIDHCPDCHGVWFDSGEIELLMESLGLDTADFLGDIINSAEAASSEKKRRCPIHGQKMKKTAIGEDPRILIDACLRGDGLWFDGGEVHQVIRQLAGKPSDAPGSRERVTAFLREAFKADEHVANAEGQVQ